MSGINVAAIHRARIATLGLGGIGAGSTGTGETGGISFGETLKNALNEVSATQEHASDLTGAFLRGEPVEMHQLMAAAEESGIAVEMLVGIVNKVQEAYRSLISMQS
jgi:flagellar hook-basal body complex protein FliE